MTPPRSSVSQGSDRRLKIAVPPSTSSVEYFQKKSVSVLLSNSWPETLLVERLTLRFHSDANPGSIYVEHACNWQLKQDELREQVVLTSPTPIYLANTNMFDVMVTYRVFEGAAWSRPTSEIHWDVSYLIIVNSALQLGQVFISFKQPEDLPLAQLLERFARRAGFSPYLAIADLQTGTILWEKIEPAIRNSAAGFIIWTKRTRWGTGVEREIELFQKHAIPQVMLVEDGCDLPNGFDNDREYTPFDRGDPAQVFSDVVSARRRMILEGS
jgi:hypothetical protein